MKNKRLFLTLCLFLVVLFIFVGAVTAFAEEEHTIVFDSNGHGEGYELRIPDGKSYYDYEMSLIDNAEEFNRLNKLYYAEVDENGVHYKVEGYYLDKEGTEGFSHSTPITEDMTVYAQWEQRIDKIELEVTPPVAGTTVETPENYWQGQTNTPEVSIPENAKYSLRCFEYEKGDPGAYWMKGKNGTPFNGTFEAGEKYYALIWVAANDGYYYKNDELSVDVKNGTYLEEESELDTNLMLVVEVTAVEKPEEKMPEANEKPKDAETEIPYTGRRDNSALIITLFAVLTLSLFALKPYRTMTDISDNL